MKDTYVVDEDHARGEEPFLRRSSRANVLRVITNIEVAQEPATSENKKRTISSQSTATLRESNLKKKRLANNSEQMPESREESSTIRLSVEQKSKTRSAPRIEVARHDASAATAAKRSAASSNEPPPLVAGRIRGAPIPTRAPATALCSSLPAVKRGMSSSTPCETSAAISSSSSSSSSSAATTTASESGASMDSELSQFIRAKSRAAHARDPSLCLGQIDRMYSIYYETVDQFTPGQFLQRDINFKMRAILVDWLIDVNWKSGNQSSTLWLCVNIIDRFLERVQVSRAQLQLVGVTAFLLASKFEEIFPPEIMTCMALTDYHYERAEVLAMERDILAAIDYQVCVPTGHHFLSRYLDAIGADDATRFLAMYYYERNLQEADSLLFKPHVLAAATVYCALCQHAPPLTAGRHNCPWPATLQRETGLREADVITCARLVVKHVSAEVVTASKRHLVSAKTKYASDKLLCVSQLPLPHI